MRNIMLILAALVLVVGCAPSFERIWKGSVFSDMDLERLQLVNRQLCAENVDEWNRILDEEDLSAGMRRIAEAELAGVELRCSLLEETSAPEDASAPPPD